MHTAFRYLLTGLLAVGHAIKGLALVLCPLVYLAILSPMICRVSSKICREHFAVLSHVLVALLYAVKGSFLIAVCHLVSAWHELLRLYRAICTRLIRRVIVAWKRTRPFCWVANTCDCRIQKLRSFRATLG
jgi:hypothetical protein